MANGYMDNEQLLKWLDEMLRQRGKEGAYGKLVLHIEAGKVTRATEERSYKIPKG